MKNKIKLKYIGLLAIIFIITGCAINPPNPFFSKSKVKKKINMVLNIPKKNYTNTEKLPLKINFGILNFQNPLNAILEITMMNISLNSHFTVKKKIKVDDQNYTKTFNIPLNNFQNGERIIKVKLSGNNIYNTEQNISFNIIQRYDETWE